MVVISLHVFLNWTAIVRHQLMSCVMRWTNVPANKEVLFGHHFTSIAGLGPIIGPAIAVIWGWVPAVIWIVAGSIFMGAVHDFGSLVISMRARGRSIGDVTADLINPRVRTLFMIIIFLSFGL